MVATVIVSGAIANKYGNGGATWTRLNWALGFRELGFQVYFIEQIERAACVDAAGMPTGFDECVNLAYFAEVTRQFGLEHAAALVYEGGERVYGLTFSELQDITESAALLINITGHLTLPTLRRSIRRSVYIDLDPGFTQFWHASGNRGFHLENHDFYFTVGENIGRPDCPIPTGEIAWRPIRQPVVLDLWPEV